MGFELVGVYQISKLADHQRTHLLFTKVDQIFVYFLNNSGHAKPHDSSFYHCSSKADSD